MDKLIPDEHDPYICPFFDKTGSCNKGDLCNKIHRDLPISRTIVFHHIFPDPDMFISMLPQGTLEMEEKTRQRLVDSFFIDIATMLMQFGQLDDMVICGNKTDNLVGSVLAVFHDSNAALAAQLALNGQYYAGRKIQVSFVPIPRMSIAICNKLDNNECTMGNQCSFIHPLEPDPTYFNQVFPKAAKGIATPFRNPRKKRFIDNPNDALYERTKQTIIVQ